MRKRILVTGASGYIGGQFVEYLSTLNEHDLEIIATDIQDKELSENTHPISFVKGDLRSEEVANLILKTTPDVVVHLAAIVTPSKGMTRQFMYEVEVEGTQKILDACVKANVSKIVVTSSGAAYGYHANNPEWLRETDELRGNEEMPYPWHKFLIEKMLQKYRTHHPDLKQVVFRVSTILGRQTNNQITDMFRKKNVVGVTTTDTPFVIIWDQDLINCLTEAALNNKKEGVFNLTGDGYITLKEIADKLGKRFIALPPKLVEIGLRGLKLFGVTQYDPEQIKFVQYRPVLDNTKLKTEFGYKPQKNSVQAFEFYAKNNGLL